MNAGHSTKLATGKTKAPKPIEQRPPGYTYGPRRGAPVMYAPAEGAIVYTECHDDAAPRTLLVDAVPELMPEKVLGFACFAIERERDGYTDWDVEAYPFTLHGVLDFWFAIAWPDGCVEYGDDRCQTNDERLGVLRARVAFEASLKQKPA